MRACVGIWVGTINVGGLAWHPAPWYAAARPCLLEEQLGGLFHDLLVCGLASLVFYRVYPHVVTQVLILIPAAAPTPTKPHQPHQHDKRPTRESSTNCVLARWLGPLAGARRSKACASRP